MDFFESRNMDSDTDQELEDENALRYDLYYLCHKLTKILGFMKVFKVIAARLGESIVALSKFEANQMKLLTKLEAELYILSGALKKVNENDPETVSAMQDMLRLILEIKYPRQKILFTAIKIIARSSCFFGNRIELLQLTFKMLAECINDKKFENAAAEAICNLCKNNRSFVLENLSDFVTCRLC